MGFNNRMLGGGMQLKKGCFIRGLLMAGPIAVLLAMQCTAANADTIKPYFEFKQAPLTQIPGDLSTDTNGASAPVSLATNRYVFGFEGVSQYDGATFNRNFIPPDTIGAVGKSQYFETTNGAYAVFDKTTGTRLALMSDVQFWANAGQTGANGDTRVLYNADAQRWVAVAFGANTKDLQIAISDTDNALGPWKSTKFQGYAGLGGSSTVADYPTLALDKNAVYIGTNDFANTPTSSTVSFRGTTLNVIPLDSLFNAAGPTTANLKQFVTPFTGSASDVDRGFALQGVNSSSASSSGTVVATSLFQFDSLAFKVNGLSSSSAVASTITNPIFLGEAAYTNAGPARQPAVSNPANQRVIATLDDRISSSVYEANGRIYYVKTVNSTADGLDEARVRYTVLNAQTLAILDQGDIGQAGYDFYQGSIAVNVFGEVVIGYNRSGLDPTTGKIRFYAQTFSTDLNGKLVATSDDILLHESLTDDYHNGSIFGQNAAGRQRWGDYSQVSIDPDDPHLFYLIGEFAREYNLAQFGHPGGNGGSRWGTWIAAINATANLNQVPEPAVWMLLLIGLAAISATSLRRGRNVHIRFS